MYGNNILFWSKLSCRRNAYWIFLKHNWKIAEAIVTAVSTITGQEKLFEMKTYTYFVWIISGAICRTFCC